MKVSPHLDQEFTDDNVTQGLRQHAQKGWVAAAMRWLPYTSTAHIEMLECRCSDT